MKLMEYVMDNDAIFLSAVKAAQIPMIIADATAPDMPIVCTNAAFEKMTGYGNQEVIGMNCRFLQGAETDPEAVAMIRNAVNSRQSLHIEILNYRKNGQPFWNALSISPIYSEQGVLSHYFASQLDVTERRRSDAAQSQLLRLNAVAQIAAGVAHGFNNLLQIIGGAKRTLAGLDDGRSAGSAHALTAIDQAIDRGVSLTAQLLSYGGMQHHKSSLFSVEDLVNDALARIRPHMAEEICCKRCGATAAQQIIADRDQAEIAIVNILTNAVESMPSGGKLEVATRVHQSTGERLAFGFLEPGVYAAVDVIDSGVGIPADDICRCIEPFFSTKPPRPAVGLGLSTAHGFIQQTGGVIDLKSREKVGTTTTLYFPAA